MENTQRPQWVLEFGADFNVPDVITNHPLLCDLSWHNDICPSFCYNDPDSDYVDARLWVSHPDVAEREFAEQPRFWVRSDEGRDYFQSNDENDATKAVDVLLAVYRGEL